MAVEVMRENTRGVRDALELQSCFPQFYFEGDVTHGIYSDIMERWDPGKYKDLYLKHFGNVSLSWESPDPEKTKDFLEDYLDEEIDGFRVIRLADTRERYRLWRLETYKKASSSPSQVVYSGNDGPLVAVYRRNVLTELLDSIIDRMKR